ncbi:MAG: transposase [Deltaproteobacteria bacterium]|nr:transposase [Deltaproteobacteria bacterium]
MARPLRIEYPEAWYHVMNRSRKKELLFRNPDDYTCFLDLLKETIDLFKINISAYCLMPNHYHLLIQTPHANLSRCMRHINGVYTQRYNRKHKTDGTILKGRYKSIIVDGDSYLLQLVRYIHRNPLGSGKVKALDQYQWTSHNGYLSNAKKWDWLNKEFILSILDSKKHMRIASYRKFMRQTDSEEITDFFNKKNVRSILGNNEFIEWIKDTFSHNKKDKEVPESKILLPDIGKIIKVVCQFYKIKKDQLFLVKRGVENEPRSIAIYLMRYKRGDRLLEIGKLFNLSKHSSISSVLERVRSRLKTDKKFKSRFEKVEKLLYKSH